MIGCYIHHQGSGHLHRTLAWSRSWEQRTGTPVTGLSTLPEPPDWNGTWLRLPSDEPEPDAPGIDPAPGGALHWAPMNHPGLRKRMSRISEWIMRARPELLVVDVSVEVALLARLHGVPVVTVAQPGDRRDTAHQLGYSVSAAVAGFWPAEAEGLLLRTDSGPPTVPVGALSRFDAAEPLPGGGGGSRAPQVTVMSGRGGGPLPEETAEAVQAALPQAQVTVLGGPGTWVSDPFPALRGADVVVTAAGQNSVAEVAAARTPAVVVPMDRPHEEQQRTAECLARGPWPALRAPAEGTAEAWRRTLQAALGLDGAGWAGWARQDAAERFVDLLLPVTGRTA